MFKEAMKREHCNAPDSQQKFKTSNYDLITCSSEEWRIVENCDKMMEKKSAHNRVIPDYKDLMKSDIAQRAKMKECEIIAVILYTGPMVSDQFWDLIFALD